MVLLDPGRNEVKCTTRKRGKDLKTERGQCRTQCTRQTRLSRVRVLASSPLPEKTSEVRMCSLLPNFPFLITSLVTAGADGKFDRRSGTVNIDCGKEEVNVYLKGR